MVISIVISSIASGVLASRIGYYTPFLIVGTCLTAIGTGLFTTFKVDTSSGMWIGYQVIYGFGMGLSMQAPNMAAQTVLPPAETSIGASLMFFGQQLFGAVFTSVGQNLLNNQLAKRLSNIPDLTAELIQNTGITDLLSRIPAADHAMALMAYNDSLHLCFQVGLIMACLSVPGALAMEWRNVKKDKQPRKVNSQRDAEEGKVRPVESQKETPGP